MQKQSFLILSTIFYYFNSIQTFQQYFTITARSKWQRWRPLGIEKYEALRKVMKKLLGNGFIKEATYPKWVTNLVLVKKSNGE